MAPWPEIALLLSSIAPPKETIAEIAGPSRNSYGALDWYVLVRVRNLFLQLRHKVPTRSHLALQRQAYLRGPS